MRRSKAPSVLKNTKDFCNSNSENDRNCSDPEEQYAWGSRNKRPKQSKRIFNIVWRDLSTKKHKTWKGDGTLEFDNSFQRAILKDETGKYIGHSKKININELIPDFQMIIGGKEIEIQHEIPEDQFNELHRTQVENLTRAEEEWINVEDKLVENKKPGGGFKFKPILELKSPSNYNKHNFEKENENSISNNVHKRLSSLQNKNGENFCESNLYSKDYICNVGLYQEFMCFLRPSELQEYLFQKVIEYISLCKLNLSSNEIESHDIKHVLKLICNHPSLINHKTTTNKLILHLIPALPSWTEMGPFDSGKLEFVQYFLTDLSRFKPQACIIFAKSLNVLNMLQGLCDFMNIKCLQLNQHALGGTDEKAIDFLSSEKKSTQVILLDSVEMLSSYKFPACCKKLILFEQIEINRNLYDLENLKDMIIYNLITAFSIEELLLLGTYDNTENLLDELVNISRSENVCCYLQSKIQHNCFGSTDESSNQINFFINNWKHYKYPFDGQLLKISSLENFSENIVSIFCKENILTSKNK